MNKIEYDKGSEAMSVILADKKSVDSDIQGNVVIDYDKKGDIVKVNFYNFSFDVFRKHKVQFNSFVHNLSGRVDAR